MNLRAAGIVACIIVAGLAGCSTTAPSRTDPAPRTSASAPASVTDGHSDDGVGAGETAAPTPQALDTIAAYVRAWARPQLNRDAWLAGVLPHTTPEYGQLLATVDPANVPATTITGPATIVTSTTATLTADIPTDAEPLRVTVIYRDDRWLVTGTGQQREKR